MKNKRTLEVLEQINEVTILEDDYARLKIKEELDSITLEICCNEIYDINYILSINYPKDAVSKFLDCAEKFNGKNVITFQDEFLDTELEIGFEITKYLSIYFEIIDYKKEVLERSKFTTFKIYSNQNNYKLLKAFIDFIKNQENKKELGENYENRINTIEHERPSRLRFYSHI